MGQDIRFQEVHGPRGAPEGKISPPFNAAKLSTGIAHLDVEPFPRMKLMKLYYLTLEEIKDLPDKYGKP